MLSVLCDPDAMKKAVVITTMWGEAMSEIVDFTRLFRVFTSHQPMCRLYLHASALNNTEYDLYTSSSLNDLAESHATNDDETN
jgi:hypothetical protein